MDLNDNTSAEVPLDGHRIKDVILRCKGGGGGGGGGVQSL